MEKRQQALMEKRYQVFVSSTFIDLKEERNEVIKALLELDCIPCAMEFFPSSDTEQETFIRQLMKTCDYYIVIVGGRYGSETTTGTSYTQMEYSIAKELQIPELVFIHEDIGKIRYEHIEKDPVKLEKLKLFLSILGTKLYKPWSSAQNLAAIVSRSLTQLIKSKQGTGWIRGDAKTEEHLLLIEEINHLNGRINDLQKKAEDSSDVYKDFDDAWARKIEETLQSHYERCVKDSEILKVRLMGLCLHKSFPKLSNFLIHTISNSLINNKNEGARIEIRLSVLNPECASWKLLNKRWEKLLPLFQIDLENLVEKLKDNKAIDISLKLYQYSHMPNWHGLLINHEELFLGTCMWDSSNCLTAGENIYQHFKTGASEVHNHLIKLYTRWFDYGRLNGTKEVIYDSRPITSSQQIP